MSRGRWFYGAVAGGATIVLAVANVQWLGFSAVSECLFLASIAWVGLAIWLQQRGEPPSSSLDRDEAYMQMNYWNTEKYLIMTRCGQEGRPNLVKHPVSESETTLQCDSSRTHGWAHVASRFVVVACLIGVAPLAEGQTDKVPQSSNPALLESQRIGPEPTPDLKVPSVPGTQAIVLREYVPTLRPEQAISPVVLHIPDRYFGRTTGRPAEMWGINLLVQYPTMEPLRKTLRPCTTASCGDEILIHLQINRQARSQDQVELNELNITNRTARGDPLVVVSRQDPPPDYSEAYVQTYPKMHSSLDTELIYVKKNADDLATEYVRCFPKTPNPLCHFYIELAELPSLQIYYSASMKYWNERNDVRAAVENLVRSFLPARLSEQ